MPRWWTTRVEDLAELVVDELLLGGNQIPFRKVEEGIADPYPERHCKVGLGRCCPSKAPYFRNIDGASARREAVPRAPNGCWRNRAIEN